ncbi:glycosyltransferase family 2 protein [[Eubacterium] cellulosolvens]
MPETRRIRPKISVVIITLVRPNLRKLIEKLLNQTIDYEYEIILITSYKLQNSAFKNKKIKIYFEPLGEGFSYYRNAGIKHSRGEIIVFIDDDELPIDKYWLRYLTDPIIKGKESVTTAGYRIPLGQGYLADSISSLGFPGGGYIGFKTIWDVNKKGYTHHLCTGNFAIKKSLLEEIGYFPVSLKFGAEDVWMSLKIIEKKIKIKYIERATVYHEARRNLIEFMRWQIRRGKATFEFNRIGLLGASHLKDRFISSLKIMRLTFFKKYFILICLLLIIQYLLNIIGYLLRNLEMKNTADACV